MNRKSALAILLAFLVFSVCFTAIVSASSSGFSPCFDNTSSVGDMEQFSVCVPLVFGVGLHSNSSHPLEQPTRQEIYSFIKDNPGVHFRGICSALHLSIGMVQYHLTVLEHADLVVVYNDGQTKRYFEDKLFTVEEMRLFSLMRHETTSKIITILAQNESVVHRDIAFALNVSSQAVTWQMNQLKKAELISSEKTGVNIKYTLNDPDTLKKILT